MALQLKGFSQNSLRSQKSWVLLSVNSFFVVISTFTTISTQMQTPNNSLTFFFGRYVILCASSSGTHLGTMKKPFVLWNAPLRRRHLYWRTLSLSFLWNCGLTPLHMVWVPLLYSFISMETAAWLPTRHKLWKNTTKHWVTTSDLFYRSEIQWLMCYHDCPCPPRLTKRFICYPSQTRR